jgi:hypothetical protein
MKQCGHELMVIHGFLVPECSRDAERQSEQNKLCSGGGEGTGIRRGCAPGSFRIIAGRVAGSAL